MKFLILAAFIPAPALAADALRELCADRPGLNTPACTVDAGHLQIEAGLGDWTLDKQADSRTDTVLLGDIAARYGIGNSTEVRLAWTGYGHIRTRDRLSGTIERMSGIGDVTVGLKQNLANPDGKGFSLALLPEASLPTGTHGVGQGAWSARLLLPISYDLSDHVKVEMTPELDAAADADGHGRHGAVGSAAGLAFALNDKLDLSVEAQAIRDRDPEHHETQALGSLSLAYQAQEHTQLDIGAQAGLNRNSPDVEMYFGISRKF